MIDLILKNKVELGLEKTASEIIQRKKDEEAKKEIEESEREKWLLKQQRLRHRSMVSGEALMGPPDVSTRASLKNRRRYSKSYGDLGALTINHSSENSRSNLLKKNGTSLTRLYDGSSVHEKGYFEKINQEKVLESERKKTTNIAIMIGESLKKEINETDERISRIMHSSRDGEKFKG